MRRCVARLVLVLVAPALVAAALVTGYAQRPSADELAFQTYLLLGGKPSDLCGGHESDHEHCAGCQIPALCLPGGEGPTVDAGLAQPSEIVLAEWRSAGVPILSASPRGPPGRDVA